MSFFSFNNTREEKVVANRLNNVDSNQNKATASSGISFYYFAMAGVILIICLVIGYSLLPTFLNNFPLHLLQSYAFTLKTNLEIIGLSLLTSISIPGYIYYRDHGFNHSLMVANKLTANDTDDAQRDEPKFLPRKYDIFPDTKIHSDQDITALLSHLMIKDSKNIKGLDGKVKFDNNFSESLFDVANLPHNKQIRIIYDAAKLDYNPTHKHGKADYKTVKDYINHNWFVPDYENGTQDPAGVYIISTSSENTVVVSETRGGKGIKYIEPILDAWSRQKFKPNVVITDLKMELLRMYLRTFTLRGYNVKALNLILPSQTDAINFIGYAVDAAIRGNITQMEKEVSSVANIFFVNKGNQDPMWNNAASAAFKRTVYILIDYYNEQVKALKEDPTLSVEEITQRSDEALGKVTLYNAYKFTVELANKNYPREIYQDIYPKKKDSHGNLVSTDPNPDEDSKSALSIYCDALEILPMNSIRAKVSDQNKPILSVGSSEKTLASIYAVCMFGMIFFTDNTIIKLTSARPSANLDLKGFAFPRRIGVSFNKEFADRYNLVQSATVWEAFHDPAMTKPYPEKDFRYEGNIDDFRWADAYFRGNFDDQPVYLRLSIYARSGYVSKSPENLKIKEFDFVFNKDYRKSYSGRQYLINPITGQREVQGGKMHEYTYDERTKKVHSIRSGTEIREHSLLFSDNGAIKTKTRYNIDTYDIHYSDKPTALFLVTSEPSYNKVLLMTLNNLYNQQVALCKVAFSDQKPIVPTKYMLDEFGNIKSEGQGVPELDTKLSSGLGYNQQYTLILQSLSQLTSLYDNAVRETLTANSANFFFMKSKDKEMIHQLMDMNGKIHVPVKSSISMADTSDRLPFSGGTKDKVPRQDPNVTISRTEMPLFDENAYLHLNHEATDGNAIVSRGDSTILSIRDTVMPVSFELLANNLGKHGNIDKGAPASLPTMADTSNVSAIQNLPDFDEMTATIIEEAKIAPKVIEQYKKVEHKTDHDISLMDPDLFADRIMSGIRANLKAEKTHDTSIDLDRVLMRGNDQKDDEIFNRKFDDMPIELQSSYTDKELQKGDKAADFVTRHAQKIREQIFAQRSTILDKNSTKDLRTRMRETESDNPYIDRKGIEHDIDELKRKKYAKGKISKLDLQLPDGALTGTYDDVLSLAFAQSYQYFKQDPHFILNETPNGPTLQTMTQEPAIDLNTNAKSFTDDSIINVNQLDDSEKFVIRPAFIKYLISLDSWSKIANGRFENAVIDNLEKRDNKNQI